MLHIEPRHYRIIKAILSKYPYSFYVFGSRVKGNPQPLSDLDLCYMNTIPPEIINQLAEDFEESDLPYKVDLVNWHAISDEFKNTIKDDLIPFS
jgi:predicted nucleotidyltransferase